MLEPTMKVLGPELSTIWIVTLMARVSLFATDRKLTFRWVLAAGALRIVTAVVLLVLATWRPGVVAVAVKST
jgi:hypothetical protein